MGAGGAAPSSQSGFGGLDALQAGLDATSLGLDATGVGAAVSFVPDLLNAGISLGRGDFTGAGLSAAAAVPFLGAPANATRLGRGALRAKEALGFFPSKIGGGGKLQPFSRLSGQFVSFSKTFQGRLLGVATSNTGSFSAGFAQGALNGISGADLPPTFTGRQATGQFLGSLAGNAIGFFQ